MLDQNEERMLLRLDASPPGLFSRIAAALGVPLRTLITLIANNPQAIAIVIADVGAGDWAKLAKDLITLLVMERASKVLASAQMGGISPEAASKRALEAEASVKEELSKALAAYSQFEADAAPKPVTKAPESAKKAPTSGEDQPPPKK